MLDIERFCKLRPTLYHLSAADSWPCIKRHGLLSSNEILSKFSIDKQLAREIEKHRLTSSYQLKSESHGSFTLRDRTTLSHAKLESALGGSCTPDEWIDLLNRRVFFFAQRKSLERLLRAPLNYQQSHVIFEVDAQKLLEAHASTIEVADINTGYTKRNSARRDPSTFQSPATYLKTGDRQIIEVTVLKSVPVLLPLLQRVVLRRPGGREEVLYTG